MHDIWWYHSLSAMSVKRKAIPRINLQMLNFVFVQTFSKFWHPKNQVSTKQCVILQGRLSLYSYQETLMLHRSGKDLIMTFHASSLRAELAECDLWHVGPWGIQNWDRSLSAGLCCPSFQMPKNRLLLSDTIKKSKIWRRLNWQVQISLRQGTQDSCRNRSRWRSLFANLWSLMA